MTRTGAGWILTVLFGVAVVAQQSKPTFEVASIKPQRESGAFGTGVGGAAIAVPPAIYRFKPGGVFNPTHATVEALVMSAYDVKPYQIVGGPEWVRTAAFQIDARGAVDASADQMKLMVQSLLEDRFKLVTHQEQREMNSQALVIARADKRLGPFLQSVGDQCSAERIAEVRRRLPARPSNSGGTLLSGCASGLSSVTGALTRELGVPVIDETRLGGAFFYEIRFAPPGGQSASGNDPNLAPLIPALEEQLGLKLERRRGPVKVLVIDSVSQPTEN